MLHINKIPNLYNNVVVFTFSLVALNVIIVKIPFHKVFLEFCNYEISKDIERSIHGIIIIVGSIFLIRKLNLERLSGLQLFFLKSPVLLIIPFVYPMTLGFLSLSTIEPEKIIWPPLLLALLATLLKGMAEEYAFRCLRLFAFRHQFLH